MSQSSLVPTGFAEVALRDISKEKSLPEAQGQLFAEVGVLRLTTDSTYPTDKLAGLLRELIRP
jgi:hypothetical protein